MIDHWNANTGMLVLWAASHMTAVLITFLAAMDHSPESPDCIFPHPILKRKKVGWLARLIFTMLGN